MSRRRKKVRGNPAAQHDDGAAEASDSQAARPRPRASRGGLFSETTRRATERGASNPKLLVYALLGVTLFMFVYLHLYAMPQMSHFAGGFSMPGTRLTGYGVEDIERLRGVMDASATGQLNFLHKTAGIIFPVSLLLASWAVAGLMMRRGIFRWCVVGAAVIFAAVDITENMLIDRILTMDQLDSDLVALSSALTSAGWLLLMLVGAVVLGSVLMSLVQSSLAGPNGKDRGKTEP